MYFINRFKSIVKSSIDNIKRVFSKKQRKMTVNDYKKRLIKRMMKFYKSVPSSIDEYGVYFLNKEIVLPKIESYDRQFICHSGLFYFDGQVVLILKNNGNSIVDLNQEEKIIKTQDEMVFYFNSYDDKVMFIDSMFINFHTINGICYNYNQKENKDIMFVCKYNEGIYMACTRDNSIYLHRLYFLNSDELGGGRIFNEAPKMFMKNHQNSIDIVFVYTTKHKHGACRTIFIDKEQKTVPEKFVFYFAFLRFNSKQLLEKIFVSTHDCSEGSGSIIKE